MIQKLIFLVINSKKNQRLIFGMQNLIKSRLRQQNPFAEIKQKMEKSTFTDQSQIVEQLSKPQVQLSPQELTNIDIVQRTIKRYQTKISEMLKIIQRQRKQNDSLKSELKQLNQNLNVMIEKINLKNQKKQQTQKQDVTKKSLENEIKKNVAMKKQLDVLRAKVKIFEAQKITELHDEIKQKDKVIEEQNNTIKMYSKLEKQQSNLDIYKKYNEANDKINSLNGELLHLKKKLNEVKKVEELQEKNLKRQHEKLRSFEKRDQEKGKTSPRLYMKKENKLKTQIPDQSIKLKEKLQALQNAKKMSEKAFRVQTQNLKTKNKILQKDLEQSKSQLNRKDKQTNILVSKMKQISRKSNHTLEPLQKPNSKTEELMTSGLFDHRKEFKGLMHPQISSSKFDDTDSLPVEKNYKIKSVKFIWFEQHILSLTTIYELPDNSVKQTVSFSIPHQYKNVIQENLDFNEFEYIKEMEIFCSKFIEFIRIRTSRDQILEVGSEKNVTKCKKFTYDIKTNQKPIAFMGAIESKKLGGTDGNKEHLISVGLQIKKKNVFTKNRFHASVGMKSQSLMKKINLVKSRMNMVREVYDDKNYKIQAQRKEN